MNNENIIEAIDKLPLVSVLMPVWNGEAYLKEAIDSILCQTFTDFEFIIINDGSTDKTETIILSYADKRIRYYKNEKNLGIVGTLNRGIDLCKGKYIARMDADDVSYPKRLQRQVVYMENHLNTIGCGCLYNVYGKESEGVVEVATDAQDVRIDMAYFCQYAHSTLMLRRSILEQYHLRYREEYRHAEDYKLWTELLQYGDMVNLPVLLHSIRQCEEGISIVHSSEQNILAEKVRKDYLSQMGINVQHTLNEVVSGKLAEEQIEQTLNAYYPLLLRAKPHNWLWRNYVSAVKTYLRSFNRIGRIRRINRFSKVLTIKDKLAIVLK